MAGWLVLIWVGIEWVLCVIRVSSFLFAPCQTEERRTPRIVRRDDMKRTKGAVLKYRSAQRLQPEMGSRKFVFGAMGNFQDMVRIM